MAFQLIDYDDPVYDTLADSFPPSAYDLDPSTPNILIYRQSAPLSYCLGHIFIHCICIVIRHPHNSI